MSPSHCLTVSFKTWTASWLKTRAVENPTQHLAGKRQLESGIKLSRDAETLPDVPLTGESPRRTDHE